MASVAVSLFPAPADEFDYGTIEQYDRLFATAPVPISRDDAPWLGDLHTRRRGTKDEPYPCQRIFSRIRLRQRLSVNEHHHLSAVGNAATWVPREPTRGIAQAVKAIFDRIQN